jgi:hypothetical protein
MKALTQSKPNKWYIKMYLVCVLHYIVLTNENGSGRGSILPTEKMYKQVTTQATNHAAIITTNTTGIMNIVGVLFTKSAVVLIIVRPSLMRLHKHRRIRR